ncbi:MAG: ABC transporter permease subunit [Candidatus Latescibacteria bacterium]|nr:ABC transporter permease subunit [Candidatus Latescibacterota bacterium]
MIHARQKKNKRLVVGILLALLTGLTLLPFFMTLLMSQKTNGEILNHFWAWPERLRPEYYSKAFAFLGQYIWNTVLVGCGTIVGVVFLSSLSGYVFARIEFRGKQTVFLLILALMMVPGILTLIPAFIWYKEFPLVGGNDWLGQGGTGFLDSRWVLLIPYIAGGQVFGVFLCRSFFAALPESLFEAARIDGASEFQLYYRVALPLCLPILATLSILAFVGAYNDYVWPLVTVSDPGIQTFSVGATLFAGEGNLEPGETLAGYVLGSLPLMLVFACGMKYYVAGLTQGAVKG